MVDLKKRVPTDIFKKIKMDDVDEEGLEEAIEREVTEGGEEGDLFKDLDEQTGATRVPPKEDVSEAGEPETPPMEELDEGLEEAIKAEEETVEAPAIEVSVEEEAEEEEPEKVIEPEIQVIEKPTQEGQTPPPMDARSKVKGISEDLKKAREEKKRTAAIVDDLQKEVANLKSEINDINAKLKENHDLILDIINVLEDIKEYMK
jgi:hypothetical protein